MKHLLRFSFALLFVLFLSLPLAAQVSLGSVSLGATTTADVTLTLPTAATLGSIQVLTQGAPDLDYTFTSGGSCTPGNSYAASSTCTVEAEFSPRYPGVRSGAVVLFDNSGNVLTTVYLEGVGSGPQTTFSAGSEQSLAKGLFLPYILVDQNGNLYSAQANGAEITEETPSASGYTQSTFSLNGKVGPMAIDGAGNFYVLVSGTLFKETRSSNGYVESTITAGLSQLYATDVAVDGSGNLYVATRPWTAGTPIVKETPDPGGYTSSVLFDGPVNCRTQGGSGLDSCTATLAVDLSGNVYVALLSQVLELSPAAGGYSQKWIDAGLSLPADIAVDATGNLFIADTGNNRIVKETPWNGSYIQTVVPSQPLSYPTQVAIDQTGNVYIVDSEPQASTHNLLIQQLLKENYSAPPNVTFAATAPGVASSDSPRTVLITNNGTAALNFSSVRYYSDFPETTQLPGACTSSTSVPPGANCALTINFKPESLPSNDDNPFLVRGNVALVSNTLNSAATSQTIVLFGQETRAANSVYISSTPNPSRSGSSVSFVAAVAGSTAGPVPTGSVKFFSGATTLATVPLTSGVATFSTSALPKGTDTVSATYSGDSVYSAANSNSIAQVDGLTNPSLTLSSSASASFVGTPLQFTATVAGVSNNPTPTGSVTFLSGATNLGSAPLVSGVATLPISFPTASTQTVTASYSGDSNYLPAASLNGVDVTLTLAQNFGSVPPLTPRSTTPVTVTFPSVATLTGISVLTLGVPNLDFTQAAGGTCAVGTVYAQGATCTVNVAFNPTHVGIHFGSVAIMDSTSSTGVISTIYLQGSLNGPQLAISSNPFNGLISVPIYPVTFAQSYTPGSIAVDAAGNIFVASVNPGSGVSKWTLANGAYTQTNLTTSGGPGIAIDGGGNLFVACGPSLCKLSPQSNGTYSQTIVATGFSSLFGVAIDGAGNLYLTDSAASALYKETLQADGTYLQSTIGAGLQSPQGLALDGRGDIAVASSTVVEETLSGDEYSQSTVSSSIPSPVGVTFDASGTLFAASNTVWLDEGDGCGVTSLPPAGGQGLWQETPGAGNTWLQTMIYVGSSEQVILNDSATGDLYLVDTGLTPNTCFGVWGEVYSRPATPAAPVSFGSVLFGAATSSQVVSVYNQGNQPLKINSFHFPADFPEVPGVATECKAGTSLPPAATCTLTAVFKPVTNLPNGVLSLPFDESITLSTNSLAAPQQTIGLLGNEMAPTTASPVFSLGSGIYPPKQSLAITVATPGATIYFTTDGTTPTTASSVYKSPIPLAVTETVQAFAVAPNHYTSQVVGAYYIVQLVPRIFWPTPKAIPYGTPLSNVQLDAQTTIPGTFTYNLAIGTVLAAGEHKISLTFVPDSTRYYTSATATITLTVTQAELTVTANSMSKLYGAALPALTGTITGFVNGESRSAISGEPVFATVATAKYNVGVYPITPARGTLSATNYSFKFVPGALTITKAVLTVSAANKTKLYGAPLPNLGYEITGFVNGDLQVHAVTGAPTLSTVATAKYNVGAYAITPALGTLTARDYTFKFVPGTLTITKAVLTVSATNKTKLYGAPLPNLGYTITGFVNGDLQVHAVTGVPKLSTTATAASPAGEYPIDIASGTLAARDYTFTLKNGTLTITTQ